MLDCENIPLFPLQAVLFPGTSIPLHIFEPRYRQMVDECLTRKRPFGVVLIRSGSEVDDGGDPPEIYRVGCLARIGHTQQLDDGRYFIEATGSVRFTLKQMSTTQPYLTATVTPLDEHSSDSAMLETLCQYVRDEFRTYIVKLLERMNKPVSAIQFPDDPTALSFAVAGAMDIPLADKQRLLEAPSTDERLEMEIQLLKSRNEDLRDSAPATGDENCQEAPDAQSPKIKRVTASAVRPLLSKN